MEAEVPSIVGLLVSSFRGFCVFGGKLASFTRLSEG